MFSWFLLLFGAILPDSDYLLEWTILPGFHRTFTHSLLFLVCIFIFSLVVFKIISKYNVVPKEKVLVYTGFLTFGVFTHLLLDFLVSFQAGIPLFWPNMNYYGLLTGVVPYSELLVFNFNDPNYLLRKISWTIADMAIGVAFFFYLMWKGKIREL